MPDNTNKPPQVTNQVRRDYNAYIDWLRSKGVAGNKVLDSNKVGKKYLADYIAANPQTSLTPDLISPIQNDFLNYKNYALNQIKNGKAVFQQGVNANNFMHNLSSEDGWIGSLTSQHKFPMDYLNYLDEQGNLLATQNKGFATTTNQ